MVPFLFAVRISYILGTFLFSLLQIWHFNVRSTDLDLLMRAMVCVLCRFKFAPCTHAAFHLISHNPRKRVSWLFILRCTNGAPFACGGGGTAIQAERGPFTTVHTASTHRRCVSGWVLGSKHPPLGERVNSAPVRASFISLLPTETPLHSQVNAGRSRCTSIKLFYSHYDAIIIINRISF
jgi:hypothetical protein